MLKKLDLFHLSHLIHLDYCCKNDGVVFLFVLDWSSYIVSIAKSASKKTGPLIHSMKFLSYEIASYYLYDSTKLLCMEYCCYAWAGAPSCYYWISSKTDWSFICCLFWILGSLSKCREFTVHSKVWQIFSQLKTYKNDEKSSLFQFKTSFRSWDI